MNRVAERCRSNSGLPRLAQVFLSCRPVPLGAKPLKVVLKAVDPMPARRDRPRELTGRSRCRPRGIV
jgi:hypothetical protein